jgi:hypothetical protein
MYTSCITVTCHVVSTDCRKLKKHGFTVASDDITLILSCMQIIWVLKNVQNLADPLPKVWIQNYVSLIICSLQLFIHLIGTQWLCFDTRKEQLDRFKQNSYYLCRTYLSTCTNVLPFSPTSKHAYMSVCVCVCVYTHTQLNHTLQTLFYLPLMEQGMLQEEE